MATSTMTTTTLVARVELVADLEITEYDKAGLLKATYVESGVRKGLKRVDVIRPRNEKGLTRRLIDIFLPDGYPHCVSDDYTAYQIYDTLQALAGSIAGMISSRAVWEGIGVGNSPASPTSAVLINVTRECFGRFATICFAHAMGTSIEAECKAHRLLADVFCDVAMLLDCLSLSLPTAYRLPILCLSSTLFAASGVSGRSAKSSISSHFAKWNNIAELNATESSQETAISLLGMLLGSIIIYLFPSRSATWILLLILLSTHLFLNTAAIRAVKLRTINRQRANMLFSTLVETGKIQTPKDIASKERIFESRGGSVLRWETGSILGHCEFGVPLGELVDCLPSRHQSHSTSRRRTDSTSKPHGGIDLATLTTLFHDQQYILWCQPYSSSFSSTSTTTSPQNPIKLKILVVLKQGITPESQLKAWYHALLLSHLWNQPQPQTQIQNTHSPNPKTQTHSPENHQDIPNAITTTLTHIHKTFPSYTRRLKQAGWEIDIPVLETRLGVRVVCEGGAKTRGEMEGRGYTQIFKN